MQARALEPVVKQSLRTRSVRSSGLRIAKPLVELSDETIEALALFPISPEAAICKGVRRSYDGSLAARASPTKLECSPPS
jgi:hypothetical protein